MPASNGTPRSVQHGRRNVVIRVRGCRLTKIQEYACVLQTQQGARFSNMLIVEKYWAERKRSSHIICKENEAVVQEMSHFP